MGRGVIILLALSLAANVFLGGVVAGKMLGGPHFHHRFSGFDGGRHGHFDDLSPAAREALKRAFVEHRRAQEGQRATMHDLHREFIAALSADAWDRAAAEAVAQKLEAVEPPERAAMARLIIDAADNLSADDRKAIARHLDRRMMKRHGGPPPEDGPPKD